MRTPILWFALFASACSPPPPTRIDSGVRDVATDDGLDAPDVANPTDVTDASIPDTNAIDATITDTSTPDATDVSSPDAPDAATCFAGVPATRLEFLNRCTDAMTTDKTVVLPLARPDGTLPPLP